MQQQQPSTTPEPLATTPKKSRKGLYWLIIGLIVVLILGLRPLVWPQDPVEPAQSTTTTVTSTASATATTTASATATTTAQSPAQRLAAEYVTAYTNADGPKLCAMAPAMGHDCSKGTPWTPRGTVTALTEYPSGDRYGVVVRRTTTDGSRYFIVEVTAGFVTKSKMLDAALPGEDEIKASFQWN